MISTCTFSHQYPSIIQGLARHITGTKSYFMLQSFSFPGNSEQFGPEGQHSRLEQRLLCPWLNHDDFQALPHYNITIFIPETLSSFLRFSFCQFKMLRTGNEIHCSAKVSTKFTKIKIKQKTKSNPIVLSEENWQNVCQFHTCFYRLGSGG